jgi:hypothetical protein
VIDGVAKKLADQFFENFQAAVEQEPVAQMTPPAEAGILTKMMSWFQ